MLKFENENRKMFGVFTNLSRPAAGNYTYPLLGAGHMLNN